MAEREAKVCKETVQESERTQKMKMESERAIELNRQKEVKRFGDQIRYHQDLEGQMEEVETKKQEAYEEFLTEKLAIDEMVRKLHEEDQQEMEKKMQKKSAMKNHINEFLKSREIWKRREKFILEEENKRIARYAREQQERKAARVALKKEASNRETKKKEELRRRMMMKAEAKEEMEGVLMDWAEEEKEMEDLRKERNDFEKRVKDRLAMQRTHQEAMATKTARDEVSKEEEMQFRRIMLSKLSEDERLEQMNANRRRMKELEHKRAVERMIDERRCQHIRDEEEERAAFQEELAMERGRMQIMEEERQKLIQRHAVKLLGYLPRGVLRDQQEVSELGEDFEREYLVGRVRDPFGEDEWEAPEPRLVGGRFV